VTIFHHILKGKPSTTSGSMQLQTVMKWHIVDKCYAAVGILLAAVIRCPLNPLRGIQQCLESIWIGSPDVDSSV
jgi:hypothetical protein